MRSLALSLIFLACFCAQAYGAQKMDVTPDIPAFQGFLRDENQELGRLEEALRGAAGGDGECSLWREASTIVESYKKTMLIAAAVQDLLVSAVFVETNLSQFNQYVWIRLNRMRLLAFSFLMEAQNALAYLENNGPGDALPIFDAAVSRIQTIHDAVKGMEARFAPLAAAP